MIFTHESVEKILAGEKTQTRRRMSDNPRSPWFRDGTRLPRIGDEISVQPGRGLAGVGTIRILEVGPQELGRLTDFEAQSEGFPDREAFYALWRELHGALDFTEDVWVIGFDLVPND